jgi:hypothetical protein
VTLNRTGLSMDAEKYLVPPRDIII